MRVMGLLRRRGRKAAISAEVVDVKGRRVGSEEEALRGKGVNEGGRVGG